MGPGKEDSSHRGCQELNFLAPSNGFGIGSPLPVQSLVSNVPQNEKLVFVQTPGLGSDVSTVVEKLSVPLRGANKTLVYLTQVEDLITTLEFGTIQFAPTRRWMVQTFHVNQQNNDQQRAILPLQVAIDNAITNSSIIPNEHMFTTISQTTYSDNVLKAFQGLIISTYGIVFFITVVSSIYHLAGMISTDRESGMTQLIDDMGGSASSRICSYILAFNIVYLPSWIVIGIGEQILVTELANLTHPNQCMALTSATVFAAMFVNRAQLSGVYCTVGFLIIGVIGMIIDRGTPSTAVVAVLSLIFPSMNYIFFSGFMSRYERQVLATNLVHAPKATSDQNSTSSVNGLELFVFLWIQILVYPVLAYFAEKVIHGASSRSRTTGIRPGTEDSMNVIEVSGLSKIYRPRLLKRWFSLGKVSDVIAVSSLDLVALKGHILCLLGANGSGKTTTLDMIGGFRISRKALFTLTFCRHRLVRILLTLDRRYKLIPGICPQRNVLWDELTVEEHVHIWNEIKYSQDDKSALDSLIEACDLSLKKNARSETLSGGQKRKLQLACMYVGGSTVCLMDEVSSGLDPLSRRVIWNIILAERSKRTMILTTHFLDEADVLSDHIAIMSHGHLKCEGSAVVLKTRLGGGYEIHLPGIPNGPDLRFPTRCYKDETVYNTTGSSEAAILLSSLESKGYTNVFVNGPTVENVSLQVVQDSPDNHSAFHGPHEKFSTQITESSLNERDMKLSSGQDISFFRQT
ncbi:P-loop containing nucleoside triphosphate hydrolase protein [Lipomyces tetrasporus]